MTKSKKLLASLTADLTTDGHIQIKNDTSGVISFYSKEYSEIEKFNSDFMTLFSKGGNIFEDKRGGNTRYKLFISDTKLAKFLKQKGVPVGNKTNIGFNIPSWIMNGSRGIQKIYLQRLFDGEGSIFKNNDGRWRLTFTMNKKVELIDDAISYFNGISNLFKKFQVKTSIIRISEGTTRKDGTKSKSLTMEVRRESLFKFYQNVNFTNPKKRIKLERAIKEVYQ